MKSTATVNRFTWRLAGISLADAQEIVELTSIRSSYSRAFARCTSNRLRNHFLIYSKMEKV